ncbi:MAG: hypothetical protein WC614_11130 [bacterium]
MTKFQIGKEYEKINHEVFVNTPFLPEAAQQRELLLEAQGYLGNILTAKANNDKVEEAQQEFIYLGTMQDYYHWNDKK